MMLPAPLGRTRDVPVEQRYVHVEKWTLESNLLATSHLIHFEGADYVRLTRLRSANYDKLSSFFDVVFVVKNWALRCT